MVSYSQRAVCLKQNYGFLIHNFWLDTDVSMTMYSKRMKTTIQNHNNVESCQMPDLTKDMCSVDEQYVEDESHSSCLSHAVDPIV